ncbi:hypothetical protein SCA6_005731 [Theobroma cacao]
MAALYLASDAVILDALGRPGSRSCIRPRMLSKDAVKQLSRRGDNVKGCTKCFTKEQVVINLYDKSITSRAVPSILLIWLASLKSL